MTGPEHYLEAENILKLVASPDSGIASYSDAGTLFACAQVHATLALAAAYGTQCGEMDVVEPIADKWRAVAS